MFNFSATNNQNNIKDAVTPNICPHCHHANQPGLQSKICDRTDDRLYTIWRCSYEGCRKIFVTVHIDSGKSYHKIEQFLNGFPKGPLWPKPILELKNGQTIGTEKEEDSKFIKTYLQSLEAEAKGYDEIAGMGYRKAIEYLVKDWAINTYPDSKDKILGLWLSGVINEFFSGDLKEILERATWLGNDQTHYKKLFEEYNIEHLKELIGLIMAELDRDFKKRHYIQNIEKRK